MEKCELKYNNYTVIIQYPNAGQCICYTCKDMKEVFDAIADDLLVLIRYYQSDEYELNELVENHLDGKFEDWESAVQMVEESKIGDMDTVKYLYNILFDDIFGMQCLVIDWNGEIVAKV